MRTLFALMASVLGFFAAPATTRAATYVTEAGVQIDRCASAWLISRFIDAKAEFVFFAEGSPPPKGIGYAFYGADFFRVGAGCTYTTLVKAYHLEGQPALRVIDAIANDTVAWRQGPNSLALAMREGVDALRGELGVDSETYAKIFPIFDLVYLHAGGDSSTVLPEARLRVDGVETALLTDWLAPKSEQESTSLAESWEQWLEGKGSSDAAWRSGVAAQGIQKDLVIHLLSWAEKADERLSPMAKKQRRLCVQVLGAGGGRE